MQDQPQDQPKDGDVPSSEPVVDLTTHLEQIAAAMTAGGRPITPDAVVDTALLAVPHAEHVGITLLRPKRRPQSAASTDEVPAELDDLQFDLDEGPCLDAATGPPVIVPGTWARTSGGRSTARGAWRPRGSARCSASGCRSVARTTQG